MDKAILIITILIICITSSVAMFCLGYKQGRDVDDERLEDVWEKGYDMGVENAREFYRHKYENKSS